MESSERKSTDLRPPRLEGHKKTYPLRLPGGFEMDAPGWVISIAGVIALAILCMWGYYKFLAPNFPQGNPLARIFSELLEDSTSLTLVILGTILLCAVLYLSNHALRPDVKVTPAWLRVCLVAGFLGSISAFAAAPSVRVLHFRSLRPATRSDVLTHLQSNTRARYVIRLIPYDQASRDYLGIAKLTNLGRCCDPTATDPANQACLKDPDPQRCTQQRYVFVADYAELRGLPVREAVARVGGSMDRVVGVSVMIFPLDGRSLYPANARGLLQVVNMIDHDHASDSGYTSFELEKKINANVELSDTSIPSYGWERMSDTYSRHCKLAEEFRCATQFGHPYSAALRLGNLSRDWHPLGLARQTEEDPCRPKVDHCAVSTWADVVDKQIKEPQIARVFLIDNYPLESLRGRYMIDYDYPSIQTIIDIGDMAKTR